MTLAKRRIAILENPAGLWLRYFLGASEANVRVEARTLQLESDTFTRRQS